MAMVATAKLTARSFNIPSSFSFLLLKRLFSNTPPFLLRPLLPPSSATTTASISLKPKNHLFSLSPKLFTTNSKSPTRINSSYSSESDSDSENQTTTKTLPDKSNLPPLYDPFNKKPVIEEPKDPKNLQEIFHNIRTGDGLFSNAVKMFDALSKDGLTHEALELFGQIKDKGNIPDVVAHTAVVEAYANAGQAKEALKVFMRMLACGVKPNVYTYSVLIKGLAGSKDVKMMKEAKKYVMEMMGKGMKVNAGTYVAVFEGFAKMEKVEEGKEFLEVMKGKGFVPDEKEVREVVKEKRGPVFRGVMDILFGK